MGVRAGLTGKLKIGDDWNAITIIALSQSNPLKAVAEFVENSIDARARHVTITRGRHKGEHYLRITDDGEGIPHDRSGAPNFKYVATHICDSVKRTLRERGAEGLQGEFGIGLLSFWTVGACSAKTRSNVILPGIFGLSASRFWDGDAAPPPPSSSDPQSGRLRTVALHDRATAGRALSAARCLPTQREKAPIEGPGSALLVRCLKGSGEIGVLS